jgi:pheromone shutdown-related protein TraB
MQLVQDVNNFDLPLDPVCNEPWVRLEHDGVSITILGTAHVSRTSADTVRSLIASGGYDGVAVELCENRLRALMDPDAVARMDIMQVMRNGKGPMVMASLALGAFQKRIADQLDIEVGADMRTAVESAESHSLPLMLIDRDIGTTLKRIYRNIPWYKRLAVMAGLLSSVTAKGNVSEEEIERLKSGDVLESTFNEFAEQSEDIYRPLVDERDQYMAARLIEEAKQSGCKNILAVVGAGHMRGIRRYLSRDGEDFIQEPQERLETLNFVPPSSSFFKMLPWLIVAFIMVGFLIGFSQSGDIGWNMIKEWVVINGALAALGSLIALAHPVTILSAFVAAPLTSLNPTISAGVVTAAVETFFRKPSVGDFSRLRSDTGQLSGWWRNRVARAFMVFLLTGIGSVAGTYIAGYKIYEAISII